MDHYRWCHGRDHEPGLCESEPVAVGEWQGVVRVSRDDGVDDPQGGVVVVVNGGCEQSIEETFDEIELLATLVHL